MRNRIPLAENTYYQFGDLRVETKTHSVVIEVESAGGVTNLAKHWYLLEMNPSPVKQPIILMHIFRRVSEDDHGSHLALWDSLGKDGGRPRRGTNPSQTLHLWQW
jgi:hypothetical protein